MNIYIEFVIIDNMVIDFVLLFLTAKLFKQNISKVKLLLACLFGTAIAVLFPLLITNFYLSLAIKFLVGALMIVIAFNKVNFKKLMCMLGGFYLITFALGGAVFGIFEAFKIDSKALLVSGYKLTLPLGVFVLAIFLFVWFTIKIIKSIYIIKAKNKFIYEVKIVNGKKTAKVFALYDSGNSLTDSETGQAVSVINLKTFEKLCPNVSFIKLINKSENINLNGAKFIPFASLGVSGSEIFVFKADALFVKDKDKNIEIKNPLLAVSIKKLNFNSSFDVILNSKLLSD